MAWTMSGLVDWSAGSSPKSTLGQERNREGEQQHPVVERQIEVDGQVRDGGRRLQKPVTEDRDDQGDDGTDQG